MTRILKYKPVNDIVEDMPKYAKVVRAGFDIDDVRAVWALVTAFDELQTGPRKFVYVMTDGPIPEWAEYRDTQRNERGDVWHVFEVPVDAAGEETT